MDLWKFRANGCLVSKSPLTSRNPVVNAVLKKLVQVGNFPDGCPLKKVWIYMDYLKMFITLSLCFDFRISITALIILLLTLTIFLVLLRKWISLLNLNYILKKFIYYRPQWGLLLLRKSKNVLVYDLISDLLYIVWGGFVFYLK